MRGSPTVHRPLVFEGCAAEGILLDTGQPFRQPSGNVVSQPPFGSSFSCFCVH